MHPKLCWWVWDGHWVALGDQQRIVKLPAWSPQGVLRFYLNVHTKVYALFYVEYGHQGEFLFDNKTHLFCYQKDRTSSRSVSMYLYLSYDALRAHREAVVTSDKIWHFLLAATRPIAHSGGCACIRNCVGEFGMDTWWPLVTSNRMW